MQIEYISLNVSKTELVIFKPKRKCLNFDLKLKLTGKRLSVGKLFINCKLPPIFNNWFTFSGSTHNYETSYVAAVLYFEFFFLFLKTVFIKGNLLWSWLCYMGIAFWLITLVVFIRCKFFFFFFFFLLIYNTFFSIFFTNSICGLPS